MTFYESAMAFYRRSMKEEFFNKFETALVLLSSISAGCVTACLTNGLEVAVIRK